jgi:hypothetical protein
MDNNYAGMNGYVWWVGVVENVFDPLKLGRLQVRIIGWHTDDLNAIPSESLPWAQTVLPLTDTNRSLDVMPGDWVTGFFLDGTNGQNPVVSGSLNGITPANNNTTGFSAQLTPQQQQLLPQKAAGVAVDVVGQPTSPPALRGVMKGTTTNIANNNRAHVCDISAEMKRASSWVKMQFGVIVEGVRKAIRAVLLALGFTPDGTSSRLKELAAAIKAEAKKIKKILKEVNDAIEVFSRFVQQVKQMIEWILSLPAKLLALLKDCLSELQKSLTKSFTDLFSPAGSSSIVSDIRDIANTVKDVASEALNTVNNAAAAAADAAAVVTTVTTAVTTNPIAGLKLN